MQNNFFAKMDELLFEINSIYTNMLDLQQKYKETSKKLQFLTHHPSHANPTPKTMNETHYKPSTNTSSSPTCTPPPSPCQSTSSPF